MNKTGEATAMSPAAVPPAANTGVSNAVPESASARASASAPAAPEKKKRKPRGSADAPVNTSFSFYEGQLAADGKVTSLGREFGSELEAKKASVKNGKPYLKIEVLQAELVEKDGNICVEATPVKK